MKTNPADTAKRILSTYIEQNKYRKTPERFAVLDAVYSFSNSYFSIQDLNDKLVENSFPVSRATLYNTIKLLMSLRLVLSLRLREGVRYKACFADNLCYQVCVICGKVTEVKVPNTLAFFEEMHLKRFRKESFSMYIYGTCSTCQAMLTRLKNKESTINKNKHF